MTNLRVLTVLMVLATVSWEANCWIGYITPRVCSGQVMTYDCARGTFFRVERVEYQPIGGDFNDQPGDHCLTQLVSTLNKRLRRKCEGKRRCRVKPKSLARYGRKCKKQEFCLQLTLQCQSRRKG